jgi:hypothetical protein
MSKGGGNSKTTNLIEPWSQLKPYLTGAYDDAQQEYQQGAPQYYGGNTVAPMSGYTKGALDSMAQRASQGSPLVTAAQGQLTDTLSGDYLNADSNPYFQNAVNAAIRPVTQQYNEQVMPGLNSDFSMAGRYGGGAHQLAAADASGQYMNTIGDMSSQMAYQNYGDERQRQIQGMLFAPELANQDYRDIGMLGQAGAGYDQYNQALINANREKWDYGQTADMQHIANYLGLLNGSPYQTQTTKAPTQGSNAVTGGIGGALTGASLGSSFGPFGTGVGALLGGGAGILGSIFG